MAVTEERTAAASPQAPARDAGEEMKGSIIAAAEGDLDAARRAQELATLQLREATQSA